MDLVTELLNFTNFKLYNDLFVAKCVHVCVEFAV